MLRSMNLLLCVTVFLWKEAAPACRDIVPCEGAAKQVAYLGMFPGPGNNYCASTNHQIECAKSCDKCEPEVPSRVMTNVPAHLYWTMDAIANRRLVEDPGVVLYYRPAKVPGMQRDALQFNGGNQWMDLGLIPCFSDLSQCSNDGYTLSAWLYLFPEMWDEGHNYILSSGGQEKNVDTGGIAVVMKENKLRVEVRIRSTGKKWIMDGNNGIEVNQRQWFHLVVVWRQTGQLRAYINRRLKKTVTSRSYTPLTNRVTPNMYIGRPNNVDRAHTYGRFAIDELQYWNHVRTEGQIQVLFGEGLGIPEYDRYFHIKHIYSGLCLESKAENEVSLATCGYDFRAPNARQQWYWNGNHIMNRHYQDKVLFANGDDLIIQITYKNVPRERAIAQVCQGEGTLDRSNWKWKYEDGYLKTHWSWKRLVPYEKNEPYSRPSGMHVATSGEDGNYVGVMAYNAQYVNDQWMKWNITYYY